MVIGSSLFFIDAKNPGDVVTIKLKISNHTQLVQAMPGHYKDERYGNNLFQLCCLCSSMN